MSDKELFLSVLDRLSQQYPGRRLEMVGSLVYIDGEVEFNIDGQNLLYNLKRLCKSLNAELI